MSQRILVTAALPYANGSIHLGHLVEYCQVDMYVRALRSLGHDALYICADDTHGTPIEVNAQKQGIEPTELVARYHEEHKRDFARFGVRFDNFTMTHSDTNRATVYEIFERLKDNGHIVERDVDGMWDGKAGRFLPDRFIRGICPNCKTPDQYGDVCESCNSTYSPRDLIEPRSVLSGETPEVKTTSHLFFELSAPEHVEFLRSWIDSGALQDDVANYVRNWIEKGLRDWDITRDGPYFGFEIPGRDNQYFYVWLDAPIGYVASSAEWGRRNGVEIDELWRNADATRIEHVIGKDIVYFHTLFWPAVLNAAGYTLPSKVHVHGFLTVDGAKMSKSRGTFINAAVFADHVEPEALRYYYACKYSATSDDLDLSFDDFITRTNAELVNKHANLFSRAAQFLNKSLDGQLGELPFTAGEAQEEPGESEQLVDLARRVVKGCRAIEGHYRKRELAAVVRELSAIADIGNEYMQEQKPWEQMKANPEEARQTLTFALNVCHALAMYLEPIVPEFCAKGAQILGIELDGMKVEQLFTLRTRKIAEMVRLFDRLEKKALDKVIEASRIGDSKTSDDKSQKKPEKKKQRDADPGDGKITIKDFAKVELKAGRVLSAERMEKSDKLLKLSVDVGEAKPRQIVSGIAPRYAPEDLEGTQVVVVTNLAPAKLRGVSSEGMILAGGEGDALSLVRIEGDLKPGTTVR